MTAAENLQEGYIQIISSPALRAFFGSAELWQLRVAEQMTLPGGSAQSTFFKWKHADIELPKTGWSGFPICWGAKRPGRCFCCRSVRWHRVNGQTAASAGSPFPGARSAFVGAHSAIFEAFSAVIPRRPHQIGKPIFRKSNVPDWAAAHCVGDHEQQQTSSQRHQRPRPPLANKPSVVA